MAHSLLSLANTFRLGLAAMNRAGPAEMNHVCEMVKAESKSVIGTYRYGWPQLAASTIARKKRGNTPLIETGEMRDSIEHTVKGRFLGFGEVVGYVGSNNQKAVWQELGTDRIPPRSFLGMALQKKEKQIVAYLGKSIVGKMLLP